MRNGGSTSAMNLRKRTIAVVIALLCLAAVQLQKGHFTGTVSRRVAFSKSHHSEGEHAPSGQHSTSLDDDSVVVAQPAVHNTEKQVTWGWRNPRGGVSTIVPHCENWCKGHRDSWEDKCSWGSLACASCAECSRTGERSTRPYIRESISSDFWKSPVLADAGVLLVHCKEVPVFKGYLKEYGVGGKPHSRLLRELLVTLKETNPGISVSLVTDYKVSPDLESMVDYIFQVNYDHHDKPWREKLPSMRNTPYNRTLLLDTDTKVCDDLKPIFDSLNDADISTVRQVVMKDTGPQVRHSYRSEPYSHRFYSAMFAYNRNSRVEELIQEAIKKDAPDQHALNKAIKRVVVTNLALPNSAFYACREDDSHVAVVGAVLIVHGVTATCNYVNNVTSPRYVGCELRPQTQKLDAYILK